MTRTATPGVLGCQRKSRRARAESEARKSAFHAGPRDFATRAPKRNGEAVIVRYDPNRDYYTILGVSSVAAREEIDRVFREMSRRLHPDKHPGREAEMTERFQRLAEAHQTLRDEEKRRLYDEMRARYFRPPEPAPEPAPPAEEPPEAEAAPEEDSAEEPYWRRRRFVYSIGREGPAATYGKTDGKRRGGFFGYRDFFKNLGVFATLALAFYLAVVAYALLSRDLEFAAREGLIEVVRWGEFAPGAEGSSDGPMRWAEAVAAAVGAGGLLVLAVWLASRGTKRLSRRGR